MPEVYLLPEEIDYKEEYSMPEVYLLPEEIDYIVSIVYNSTS